MLFVLWISRRAGLGTPVKMRKFTALRRRNANANDGVNQLPINVDLGSHPVGTRSIDIPTSFS